MAFAIAVEHGDPLSMQLKKVWTEHAPCVLCVTAPVAETQLEVVEKTHYPITTSPYEIMQKGDLEKLHCGP